MGINSEGKILKDAIALSDYKINEIIDITGISRGTIYNLYKQNSIEDIYKTKFSKLESSKIKLEFNTKSTKSNKLNQKEETIKPMEKRIKELEEKVIRQDEAIRTIK